MGIPCAGIGENDLVARLKAVSISIVLTELRPSLTGVRTASELPETSLKIPTVLFS